MLTVVVVLGLCGVAGGYLFGRSDLLVRTRERWARGRDVLDAAMDNDLDGFNAANPGATFGLDPIDLKLVPDLAALANPDRRLRARMYWGWFWRALAACNICSGVHAIFAMTGLWAALAAVASAPAPVPWHDIPAGVGRRLRRPHRPHGPRKPTGDLVTIWALTEGVDQPYVALTAWPIHRDGVVHVPSNAFVGGPCGVHATAAEHVAAMWTPCVFPERPMDRHTILCVEGACVGCDLWREHTKFGELTEAEWDALPELSMEVAQ